MTNTTLKHRRSAIVAGLAAVLDEEQVLAAMQLWERELNGGGPFNLQRYVDRVHDTLAPSCSRRELHRSLVRNVFLNDDMAPAPEITGINSVFQALVSEYLKGVSAHHREVVAVLRRYVIEHIARLPIDGAAQDQIVDWLVGRRENIDTILAPEPTRRIIHMLYVCSCELLGPAVADQILGASVRVVENSTISVRFSPRLLL